MARCAEGGWLLPESCAAIRSRVAGTIRWEQRRREKVLFKSALPKANCELRARFKFEMVI